ncbi:3-hydroxyacyl-CoA dehydrogenase NAD-binding domain-containing protein [Flavobacteriales bacterium]|nr:3-hydroxyacyl-CoA dehydrogenase NAD-binding domain-containing protein [Flavobacteriales bacterium]
MQTNKVGVVGAGAMGAGIAQIASQAGHQVILYDLSQSTLDESALKLAKVMARLVEKKRITLEESTDIQGRIVRSTQIDLFEGCDLVVEAVVENLDVKHSVFKQIENIVSSDCIVASNTSSFSITSLAAGCNHPERVLGLHFFNPAPLMPLVEIVPAIQTSGDTPLHLVSLMKDWGKSPVIARDTPGFIVNRVARPFYGEALRILDEGIADVPTIDIVMRSLGFKMGPFQLMDLIGHDVNYAVTESVFKSFYCDPRFMPSITQLKLVEAGWLGRKAGKGFYNYADNSTDSTTNVEIDSDTEVLIAERIIAMLINEAADAVYYGIASPEDIDIAMQKGVNYPKGLLFWSDEWGAEKVVKIIDALKDEYGETRYRCSTLLRKQAKEGGRFYS